MSERESELRASDAERERAARALATHFADGRLDRTEFDERVETAYAARTRPQLDALFVDLPGPSPVPAERASAEVLAATPGTPGRPADFRRPPFVAGLPLPLLVLMPVLLGLAVTAVVHGLPPFPLVPLLLFFVAARRGRRWNRQAGPRS